MKNLLLAVLLIIGITMASCDKIEVVEVTKRTIVVSTLHNPVNTYTLDLGLNVSQNVVHWLDTVGEVSHTFNAQAGDVLFYLMATEIPGSQLSVTIDGQSALIIDVSGSGTNTVVGTLFID